MCEVCKAAEGEMPTECPSREMSLVEKDAVFGGWADYKNGRWDSRIPTKNFNGGRSWRPLYMKHL